MEIPKAVREAAVGLGTEINYEHQRDGYAVYSVGMKSKQDPPCPTGLPLVVLYKEDRAKVVSGVDALDWL